MTATRYLVVGAGLAGSATAWHLATRGCEVTLVERTAPAAINGSSHGSARIFRYAYEQRRWVDLVVRAAASWRELERQSARQLVTPTSALDLGAARDPRGLARLLEAAGVEHELLSVAEAGDRWPQLADDGEVLHTPGGGVLDAEGSVHAMVDLARAHGAQVLTDWPVARVERTATGFVAHAPDGRRLDAGHVVVAAGGWLPDLLGALPLPAGFLAGIPPLEVREENAFHFPYREAGREGLLTPWPTVIHKRHEEQVYALPGGRDAGFAGQKVAAFNAGRVIGSASAQTGRVRDDNRARVTAHVRRFFPGLVPEPYAETTCLFTNTPDEEFVIDSVDGITVASPCSGHGAKFAPLLGEIVADVATGAAPAPEEFRVTRG